MKAARRSRCVVVGLDGIGTGPDPVLAAALEQARWSNAELCVVHALPIRLPEQGAADLGEIYRHELAERPAVIRAMTIGLRDHVAGQATDEQLITEVRYEVRHGDPATLLLMAAQQADLIVLGTRTPRHVHHRTPFLLGPVSQDVTLNATCPTMLVPRR